MMYSYRSLLIPAFFLFWNGWNIALCNAFVPSAAQTWLERVFSPPPSNEKTNNLKQQLLQLCQDVPNPVSRSTMESLIEQLTPLSPIQATAISPLLQKKWILQWTTEKEINFFLEKGISLPGSIYQVIDGTVLENRIPFRNGGSFGVTGALSIPDAEGMRTDFVFTQATLDVGRWGVYQFPPVGQGWFETLYLDDNLRIDLNSRNDILICTSEEGRNEA